MKLRRGALTDHYVEGDRSVVMVDESVLGLSPVATAILEAVPDGAVVSLLAVTEHVVEAFGPPEGPESAEELTQQQVWDLVAHKVLVLAEHDGSRDGAQYLVGHRGHDLPDDERAAAVTVLRQALRHLRSDEPGLWAPSQPVSAAALVAAARQHHVIPYLAAHLDRLSLPGRARSELEAMAERQQAGAARLASDLDVAIAELDAAGVRALAFKGVTLAALAYDEFSRRGAGDLDLLVAPGDLARAHHVLDAAGWTPAPGYPRPGTSWAWRHFVRTGNELLLSSTHSDIDLHWHLVPTRGTFPEFESLWQRRELVLINGRTTPTLSLYDALAHSAGHAAKDRWKWLRSLLDVHVLASRRETWLGADRPLRGDELLSLGLAVRAFGTPEGAPPVVDKAAESIDDNLWRQVHHDQVETSPEHRPLAVPGINFLFGLRGLSRTGATPREVARLLSRSALPPWHTADETSRSALVVPRVLAKRTRELVRKAGHRD